MNPLAKDGVTGQEACVGCLPIMEENFWPQIWLKVGIALVLAGQGMMLGLGLNTAEPPLVPAQPMYWVLHGGLFLSAWIVVILLGGPLVRETWQTLKRGRITVDALFTLSVGGALLGSMLATWRGEGSVYYEVVAIVLAIYTLGKALGVRSKARALNEAARLEGQFNHALRLKPERGETERVPLEAVTEEDTLLVAPGEGIPVDGVILEGKAYVNEQPMTGEPAAVVRKTGDAVLAGTFALDGHLKVRPTALKGARRFDAVLDAIREAREQPTRLQEEADRLTRWFVPAVACVSLATFLGWLPFSGWATALFNAMAVLIVACPCALGLATPVAVWRGLAALARIGVVARSGDCIDLLARAEVFVFDKTGTLSTEQMTVQEVTLSAHFAPREAELRAGIRAMEARLAHPVARALMAWGGEGAGQVRFDSVRAIPARGIEAECLRQGGLLETWRLGSAEFIGLESGADASVFLSVNGELAARFQLGEELRPTTEATLLKLARGGFGLFVLTGDPAPAWKSLAGVQVEEGLTPAEKAARVRALAQGKAVVFVGDGINDAPAMAEASGSIALESGAELSRATADGVLLGGNLASIPEAAALSRRILHSVRGNMRFAAVYNLIGMALAAGGVLHPVVAALLMLASSLCVSIRVLRATEAPAGD